MSSNAAANAARTAVRAERISFYVSMGGPAMPDAEAAALLGVGARTVERYRGVLRAAGVIGPRPSGPPATEPCGTLAAARRHSRRGEHCETCRAAEARGRDDTERRNNVPEVPLYQWRARSYPWARRAIAAAEAVHGQPEPTCTCGRPLPDHRAQYAGKCETCVPPSASDPAAVLHFLDDLDGVGEPACHVGGDTALTADRARVTCRVCLKTRALADGLAARMADA